MNLLTILFWVILVLTFIGAFGPATWPMYYRFLPFIALFVIIGLKVFKTPLQ